MISLDDKIRAQWERFLVDLPGFLLDDALAGKWICYLDGVHYAGADQNDAYRFGLERYGIDGGFVIAQVVEQKPLHVSRLGSAGWAIVQQQYDELKAKYDELQAENKRLCTIVAKARWFCEPRDAIRALLVINRHAFDELVAALDELEENQ
ncbi:MAG TPA: hypothetical protein VNN25_27025 [Thermoanaerobaculia bacterium]|nr:hypothetical protein [Thermoanaerobaculia bacterium]